MKKALLIILTILLILMILLAVYWEPIIDFLPIDQSGWKTEGSSVFYLDEDGDPVTGWQDPDGNRRYFDPQSGALCTGWLTLADGTYYLGTDGILQTGWLSQDDSRMYLFPDGKLATGMFEAEGACYYADNSGAIQTGWADIDGSRRYFAEDGAMHTGWLELDGSRYYLDESGVLCTGWTELDGIRCYLSEDGALCTGWTDTPEGRCYLDETGAPCFGWQELDENLYYFTEDGFLHTGWLELEGITYYMKEDGAAARGRLMIDDTAHHFTSTGAHILLVNRWNMIPEDYDPELKALPNGKKVTVECYDSLIAMLEDCRDYGCHPEVIGAHRSTENQRYLFRDKVNSFMAQGNSYAAAYAKAKETVADPGTSEHELGLAVDIIDKYFPNSNSGEKNCLTWLREHCWEYGWILRYPDDKKEITGIKYESWHFRYVGVELAMEMKDSGLCLEEYLDQFTADGTTCGNPNASAEPAE